MIASSLEGLLLTFGLVVCRFSALLVALPILSEVLPVRLRVAAGLVLALAATVWIGPLADRAPAISVLAAAALSELAVGWCIGFCVRVLFSAVDAAGQFAGVQLGLSFAGNVDPLLREESIVTTRVLSALAWLGFLTVGGLETTIGTLALSFTRIAPGSARLLDVAALVGWMGEAWALSVRLALPVLAGMLILQTALALISRVVAELNPFSFAFAAMTCVGLLLLSATFDDAVFFGAAVPERMTAALAEAWGAR